MSVWLQRENGNCRWFRVPVPLCSRLESSSSIRIVPVVKAGREKGDIHLVYSKLWVRQNKGAWHLTYAFSSLFNICEGSELPQRLYKYHFQIVWNCNWNNLWWWWLIQYKLSSCRIHGHYSWKELQWYFRWPVVLIFLTQCCSLPWRQNFFRKKFVLFPVTAFVEFIPFPTVSRWAGLPCWRMLWFWLRAQHLSTFLLMELNFSVSAGFFLCLLSFSPSKILFVW